MDKQLWLRWNKRSLLLILLMGILTQACGPLRYDEVENPQPSPPFYLPDNIRVALVLGSGGVRGMAHVGVIEELVAAGIEFDLIVGCSAGSIVGALYADHPDIELLKKSIWDIRAHSLLDFDISDCRYGLYQSRALHTVLDSYLHADRFEDLKIPLVIVASDLHSGECVPIGGGELVPAVQSSCSIPLVFAPCDHLNRALVDGGVINPVPAKVAGDLGAQYVIAVDLSELLDQTEPTNLFQVASRSMEIAFMWQNQACARYADVVIRPKTCGVGTFNDKMKELLYEAGKQAAREKIPEIKASIAALELEKRVECGWRLVEPTCYTPQIYLSD